MHLVWYEKAEKPPPAHPYIHDAVTKNEKEILQLSGCRPLASASAVTAKACDLDLSFLNQK